MTMTGLFSFRLWRVVLLAVAVPLPSACMETARAPDPVDRSLEVPSQTAVYTHPQLGFTLFPPPQSRLVPGQGQGQGGADLIIESPLGYIVTIQGSPRPDDEPLERMAARWAVQNVGKGLRWQEMTAERSFLSRGRPAYDAIYRGETNWLRLVILRASDRDYVFMFFAQPDRFATLAGQLDVLLDNFKAASEPDFQEAESEGSNAPVTPPVSAPGLRHFEGRDLGYALDYPDGWRVRREGPHTLVIAPEEGRAGAVVSIQNVALSGDAPSRVAQVVADLRRQFVEGAVDPRFERDGVFRFGDGPGALDGHHMLVSFGRGGQRYRQWTIIIPRRSDPVSHVWTYAAPEQVFDRHRIDAGTILQSFMMIDF